jgi:putative SOS response-associated peptidase YedK
MCGRYYRRSDKQRLAEAFRLGKLPDGFVLPDWDYNVAPTTFQPVIREVRDPAAVAPGDSTRELVLMRWGLVPFHAKSLADYKGVSTINAKAETLQTSGLWRIPFARRRCLIPADGFYEWKKLDSKSRQPWAFSLADGQPFAFAGIWDAWKDPAVAEGPSNGPDPWLQSFTIITTTPNPLTATVHDRMPAILEPRDYARWLSREESDPAHLPIDLLRPFPADQMTAHRAHPDIGNVRNNHPNSSTAPDRT